VFGKQNGFFTALLKKIKKENNDWYRKVKKKILKSEKNIYIL
jgi:hypothetical protein